MRYRYLRVASLSLLLAVAAVSVFSAAATSAQTAPPAKSKAAAADKAWTPPRTPDGHPDLQGIWGTSSLTPLARTADLGNKQFFTPEEAVAFEKKRKESDDRDRRDGSSEADVGRAYNDAWQDRGNHVAKNLRTSLVIDPPSGKIPPLTPEAQKKFDAAAAYFAAHPADSAEELPLYDRCLLFSQGGPPMMPGNYNNNYEILQSPRYVAILAEQGSQLRVIPTDGRPHLPKNVSEWMGDSRGRWEGNTLVVDTTNLRFNQLSRFGFAYQNGMTDQNLHITERFTRTAPDMIIYQATIDDPTVYTQPWTIEEVMYPLGGAIYEYACHEGNYALSDILAGARADEKKAAQQVQK